MDTSWVGKLMNTMHVKFCIKKNATVSLDTILSFDKAFITLLIYVSFLFVVKCVLIFPCLFKQIMEGKSHTRIWLCESPLCLSKKKHMHFKWSLSYHKSVVQNRYLENYKE